MSFSLAVNVFPHFLHLRTGKRNNSKAKLIFSSIITKSNLDFHLELSADVEKA